MNCVKETFYWAGICCQGKHYFSRLLSVHKTVYHIINAHSRQQQILQWSGERPRKRLFRCWWWESHWLSWLLLTDWLHSGKWTGSSNAPVYHRDGEAKKKGKGSAWPSFIQPLHPASRRRAIPCFCSTSTVISALQYVLQLPGTTGLAVRHNTNKKSHIPELASPLCSIVFTLNRLVSRDDLFIQMLLVGSCLSQTDLICSNEIKRCCPNTTTPTVNLPKIIITIIASRNISGWRY